MCTYIHSTHAAVILRILKSFSLHNSQNSVICNSFRLPTFLVTTEDGSSLVRWVTRPGEHCWAWDPGVEAGLDEPPSESLVSSGEEKRREVCIQLYNNL